MHKVLIGFAVVLALDCSTALAQGAPKPCRKKTAGPCTPPPPVPIACAQGEWTAVSQSVTYSEWVTVGTSQERQRTTTTYWSRATLVQPANGGPACGPSTRATTETVAETEPLPPTVPPIPELAAWKTRMTSYGATHCSEAAITAAIGSAGVQSEDNVWYYDGTRVYHQIAAYTENSSWYTCAGYTNTAYRKWVGATSGSALGGWRVFPHGLAADYRRTGATASRDAALKLATSSAFAGSAGASACGYSRETAYILQAYIVAEELGEPRHQKFVTAAENALLLLEKTLVTNQCSQVVPFHIGLLMESLIQYHERTSDPRVLPMLELAADAMWTRLWQPASESFPIASDRPGEAPDLNLLIAPAYAWLWQNTGAQRHLVRGDAIFAGGIRRASTLR